MPTTYAHYRFGAEMLRAMPADVRGTANRHRHLFDVGLFGPDPLFFYRPVLSGKGRRLGQRFHGQTGQEFFCRVCRNLRREPSEGALAYLYGVLCHFALDACCHPLLPQPDRQREAHIRIEGSFDRFLMEADGLKQAAEARLAERMTLDRHQSGILARFYPGADKSLLRESIRTMAAAQRLLELPEGPGRSALSKVLEAAPGSLWCRLLSRDPDPQWDAWNRPLLETYRQAAEAFPEMLLKLIAHLNYSAPLGERFDPIFG